VGNEAARGGDIEKFAKELPAVLMTPKMFILTASTGQLAFFLAAIIPAWLSPVPIKERLGLLRPRPSWGVLPLVLLGSWASTAVGIGLAYALALVLKPDPWVEELFKNITLSEAAPFVLFIAFVPGITEELLFRGYVQRRLLERWTPGVAITVTSLLFALVHLQPHHVVLAFPIGLWLGVVAWKTGSVLPSIFCHAFINGSLNAWRMVAKFGEIPESTQQVVHIVALLVGLVCFLLAVNSFIHDERSAGAGAGRS
jgi:membrane protease YdiL (CAAX protease family)